MEPDVLATPSDSLARGAEWSSLVERQARSMSAESLNVTVAPVYSSNGSMQHHPSSATAPIPIANGSDHSHSNGWSGRTQTVAVALPVQNLEVLAREEGMYVRGGKRLLDVMGSLVALVLTAPVLAFLALLIKLESPGPVLYRSTRIGRNGRPFTFFKLRSMVNGADRHRHHLTHLNEADGPVFKISNDPRVTRIGRLLRTTSLDEIPQFLNVLNGEMSLVGPRPPIPEEVAQYEPWQMRRLGVRPGITCLWQISGRSRIGFQEWMRLDLEYIKHQSLALDLKILLRTVPAVLSREGAY